MPEVVISNTSPLQYLYQLGYLQLLPRFYQHLEIPPAVSRELTVGRRLGVSLPDPETMDWLHTHAPANDATLSLSNTLGAGEREVLTLALEMTDALVLMDDGRARRIGQRLGIHLTGTVGILARATHAGIIPQLTPVLDQLAVLGFRLSVAARMVALQHVGEPYRRP